MTQAQTQLDSTTGCRRNLRLCQGDEFDESFQYTLQYSSS